MRSHAVVATSPVKTRHPLVVAFVGLFLVVGIPTLIGIKGRPIVGAFEVLAIDARPDGTSVAVLRDEGSRYWIARLDPDAEATWVRSLRGTPQRVGQDIALVTNNATAYVRLLRPSGDIVDVHAFSLESGATTWTRQIVARSELEDGWELASAADSDLSLIATNQVVVATRRSHDDLVILDAVAGTVISTFGGASDLRFPQLWREKVVVSGGRGLFVAALTVLGTTGVERVPADRMCGVGDDAVAIENGEANVVRAMRAPLDAVPLQGFSGWVDRCGSVQGRFAGVGSLRRGSELHVFTFDRDGAMLHDIPLGASFLRTDLLRHAGAPLAGELTRFVPVIVDAGDEAQLLMIDLIAGQVAWRSKPQRYLGIATLIGANGHWYLLASEMGPRVIARFSGESGRLEVAVEAAEALGPVGANDMSSSTIWVRTRGARTFGTLPLVALDAISLLPRSGSTVELADVTARIRQSIGAP